MAPQLAFARKRGLKPHGTKFHVKPLNSLSARESADRNNFTSVADRLLPTRSPR
jgi:hypothetical protein